MRILFLHQNPPGQFRHLAPHLAEEAGNQVVFLGERKGIVPGRIRWCRYPPPRRAGSATHHYLHRMEANIRRGQAVMRACHELLKEGFSPDVVVGHAGWGETMFIRDAMPKAAIVSYCEMFYRSEGQDTGYIPETALDLDGQCRLRVWNADLLLALDTMDRGIAPTAWQRAQHPECYQPRITVAHEGVDTAEVAPNADARFTLPDGQVLSPGDEVVTFVARNLEPVRGFVALMRALPGLLRMRPGAHIVICGEDGVSYGRPPPDGGTWREHMLREVSMDLTRVHFTGQLSRPDYLALLQVSALHLYLTVPFVLSWSCIEALATGCLILGSDVLPVREVLEDGVSGVLVDGRDPDEISQQAANLLAQRGALGAMRRRARDTALQRFDLRCCLERQARIVRGL